MLQWAGPSTLDRVRSSELLIDRFVSMGVIKADLGEDHVFLHKEMNAIFVELLHRHYTLTSGRTLSFVNWTPETPAEALGSAGHLVQRGEYAVAVQDCDAKSAVSVFVYRQLNSEVT
jgi:hypothetical protein